MFLKNKVRQLFSLIYIIAATHTLALHADDFTDFPLDDLECGLQMEMGHTIECDDNDVFAIDLLLIEELNALCILQQDLYKRTNELNQRNLLDYALFLPQKFSRQCWHLGAHVFYNQTSRDNFTRKSTAICSYLAIFNENLLNEIQKRAAELEMPLPFELSEVVPLFANATVQERRGGTMFHGQRRWGDYRFRFLFPFYYLESNLFLTPEEIDKIQAAFGITDPADDLEFARNNLISDKVGFGDLRLNLDFPFRNTPGISTKLGIQATIPTAFALKKGLYGTTFKKRCRGPILDLCKLFKLVQDNQIEKATQIAAAFADAALQQFNANLIELPMGNGGHFGLGVYMRSKTPLSSVIKRPWAQNITMRSRISAEYLFPRRKDRYFIECDPSARYAALGLDRSITEIVDEISDNPAYARAVLAFLESQLTDKVFPFSLSTRVRPGMIFRWMTKYIYETDLNWGYFVGTDTWLTTKEKLSDVRIPSCIPSPLNCKIAQKPFGYQVGFLGTVFWKRPSGFLLSLNSEYNFTSTGIGSDFLVSFNFEKSF